MAFPTFYNENLELQITILCMYDLILSTYCMQAVEPYLKKDIKALETVQCHATRMVCVLRHLPITIQGKTQEPEVNEI